MCYHTHYSLRLQQNSSNIVRHSRPRWMQRLLIQRMEHIQYKLITTTKRIALFCGPLFLCSMLPVPKRVGPLREGNAPKKVTSCSSSAPLWRRLHDFYFGVHFVCRSSSRKQNAPDLSFRTPLRRATTRHKIVSLLLVHFLPGAVQP